jgi:hypothetical protein
LYAREPPIKKLQAFAHCCREGFIEVKNEIIKKNLDGDLSIESKFIQKSKVPALFVFIQIAKYDIIFRV